MPTQQPQTPGNSQPQLDPTALNLARAIRQVESGDNPNAKGASGEFGVGQWMPGNFEAAATSYGLDPNDKSEANQDHVMYNQIEDQVKQGKTQSQIASWWNSGNYDPTGNVGVNKEGVAYNTPAYVAKVQKAYESQINQPSSSTYPPPTTPGQSQPQTTQTNGYTPPAPPPATTTSPAGTASNGGVLSDLSQGNIGGAAVNAAKEAGNFLFPIAGDLYNDVTGKNTKTGLQQVGDAALSALPFIPGLGEVGEGLVGATKAGELLGETGSRVAGQALAGGALGYGADVASNLSSGKTDASVFKPGIGTVGGGLIGGAIGAAGKIVPKLLSKTSGVPEQAFETMAERPDAVVNAIKAGATNEQALGVAQGAVKNLRTTLTQNWQSSVKNIVDEFSGQRVNLGNLSKKLATVSDEFGIELPQNIKNVSAKEGIDLLTQVNERLNSGSAAISPKGAVLRDTKDALANTLKTSFGGKGGSFDTLYKDYSTRSQVLNDAKSIVGGLKRTNPIQTKTLQNRMKNLFNDDNGGYLKAVKDLEDATGIDILSHASASKFAPKGLHLGKGLKYEGPLGNLIDIISYPLSSPRLAGFASRVVSKPLVQQGVRALGAIGAARSSQ